MRYRSVKATADAWDVSQDTVRTWCRQGRIPGAQRLGKLWRVPVDATVIASGDTRVAHVPGVRHGEQSLRQRLRAYRAERLPSSAA